MKSNVLVPELYVNDLQKSLDFYTNILGFEIRYCRKEDGFAYIFRGDAEMMLDQINKGRTWKTGDFSYPLGRGVNFQIEVSDVSALAKKIATHDLELFMEVEEKWYRQDKVEVGNRQFLVQDPDGYLLRFCEDLGRRSL